MQGSDSNNAAVGDAARGLGVRNRQLTLPLMVAAVLTLIWRQVPSVSELGRVLEREDVLGQARRHVSQQALSPRLRCLPASLFGQVLTGLLPVLHARATARTRPVPAVFTRAQRHYAYIWAIDGTTLEPVFHKVGLRRPDTGTTQAGGKVEAVLDAVGGYDDLRNRIPAPKGRYGVNTSPRQDPEPTRGIPASTRILRDARVGRLATVDATNRPYVVPLCFAVLGEDEPVIVSVLDDKPKRVADRELARARNIRGNPRVALLVDHYDEDWSRLWFVQVRGEARLLAPGEDRHHEAIVALRAKYAQYRSMAIERRPVILIEALRFHIWKATGTAQ